MEPSYERGYSHTLAIFDGDGTYPKLDGDDWVIQNETRISNMDMILDKNLIISDNGRLVVENSTLRVNSSAGRMLGIIVGSNGYLEVRNSTIDAWNRTAPENIYEMVNQDNMYEFTVYGQMNIDRGFVDYALYGVEILSDHVSISNSTFNTPCKCTYSSPILIDNTFISPNNVILNFASPLTTRNSFIGHPEHPESTVGDRVGVQAGYYSNPTIVNNSFQYMGVLSSNWAHPIIDHNTFRNNSQSIEFEGDSYGTVENNDFSDALIGISIHGSSCVTVQNNSISAKCGVNVSVFSSACVINNTFQNYERYGVHTLLSSTELSGNTFVPAADHSPDSCGALQEWIVAFDLTDENRQKQLWYVPADIQVKDGNGHVEHGHSLAGFEARLPEYRITNECKLIKYNPYTISVNNLGIRGSVTLTVNRSQAFYVIMKMGHPFFVYGTMALLLAAGISVTYRIVRPKAVNRSNDGCRAAGDGVARSSLIPKP
jgi:parallel beta-helix repeat protein